MNCTNCGAPLAEGAAFCPACGTRAEAKSAAPASSAPPQYPPQQYPPQYQQQYRPPREGATIAVKPLEMILKIGAMVIALYSLIYFIVGLIPAGYAYGVAIGSVGFVSAFFGLLEGAGIAAVLFALGQLIVTIDTKK